MPNPLPAKTNRKRNQAVWLMRQNGMTLKQIAHQTNLSAQRVNQICTQTENYIASCCDVYWGKVRDPLVYNVWHHFGPGNVRETRARLSNPWCKWDTRLSWPRGK